jgi:hypothetical protein
VDKKGVIFHESVEKKDAGVLGHAGVDDDKEN